MDLDFFPAVSLQGFPGTHIKSRDGEEHERIAKIDSFTDEYFAEAEAGDASSVTWKQSRRPELIATLT